MTFDSLGGSHKAVHTCLNEWLKFEAKHKRDVQYEMTDATYWEARVSRRPTPAWMAVLIPDRCLRSQTFRIAGCF
jgi:hypothetical protein